MQGDPFAESASRQQDANPFSSQSGKRLPWGNSASNAAPANTRGATEIVSGDPFADSDAHRQDSFTPPNAKPQLQPSTQSSAAPTDRFATQPTDAAVATKRDPKHTGYSRSAKLYIPDVPEGLQTEDAIRAQFSTNDIQVVNVSLRPVRGNADTMTALITFADEVDMAESIAHSTYFDGMELNLQQWAFSKWVNAWTHQASDLLLKFVPPAHFSKGGVSKLLDSVSRKKLQGVNLREKMRGPGVRGTAVLRFPDPESARYAFRNMKEEARTFGTTFFFNSRKVASSQNTSGETSNERTEKSYEAKLREMEKLRALIAKKEAERASKAQRGEKRVHSESKNDSKEVSNGTEMVDGEESDAKKRRKERFVGHAKKKKGEKKPFPPPPRRMHLSEAKYLVGTCQSMCRMEEFEQRIVQRDVHALEKVNGQPVYKLAVKKYRRSAALSEQPQPEEIRPPVVLERTMDYLKSVCDWNRSFADIHSFVRDRTRSIRQDYTYQGVGDPGAIRVHEECVRFHLLSYFLLYKETTETFSNQQNMEQLCKCLVSLREMYDARRAERLPTSKYEPEMQAYYIIVQKDSPTLYVQTIKGLTKAVRKSPQVALAMDMVLALSRRQFNFGEFFKMMKAGDFLMACLLQARFSDIRLRALKVMNKGHGTRRQPDQMPLQLITDRLAFSNAHETREFCQGVGLSVVPNINRKGLMEEVVLLHEKAISRSVPDKLKAFPAPEFMESFYSGLKPSTVIAGQVNREYPTDKGMSGISRSDSAAANTIKQATENVPQNTTAKSSTETIDATASKDSFKVERSPLRRSVLGDPTPQHTVSPSQVPAAVGSGSAKVFNSVQDTPSVPKERASHTPKLMEYTAQKSARDTHAPDPVQPNAVQPDAVQPDAVQPVGSNSEQVTKPVSVYAGS